MMKFRNPDLGLLLIRLAVGATFLVYGIMKFNNMEGTVAFFGTLGFPAALAYLVAAIELLGGLALILGLWVDIFGILLAIVMLVAILSVTGGQGFSGGWDFNLALLAGSLGLALTGPGKHSLKKEN